MNDVWSVVAALTPPLGVGLLFFLVMRYILRADRNERAAISRLEEQENASLRAGDVESSDQDSNS